MPVVYDRGALRVSAAWDPGQVRLARLAALAPRQWKFATALALTRVAQQIKEAEIATMQRVFDRPTRWTLNGLFIEKATVDKQEARVWFKDFAPKGTAAGRYLLPEVSGGSREHKRFENALEHAGLLTHGHTLVPAGGAPRDGFGNVPRSIYTRILAHLQASVVYANQNATNKRRMTRPGGEQFFYGSPGGRGRGVWMRVSGGRVLGGRMHGSIVPIFLEHRGAPSYRSRFDFFGVAERIHESRFEPEFDKAAAETIQTAR